jgi:hypothetical protein
MRRDVDGVELRDEDFGDDDHYSERISTTSETAESADGFEALGACGSQL